MGDSGPPAVSVPLWVSPLQKNARITPLCEKSTKSAGGIIAFIYDKQTWADEKEWAFFTREPHTSLLEKVPATFLYGLRHIATHLSTIQQYYFISLRIQV